MELEQRVREWVDRELQSSPDAGRQIGKGYQATVTLLESPYGRVVVKAAHGRFSRRALRREHEIYQRLAGIDGIPKTFGMIGIGALLLEYIDGDSLRARAPEHPDRFFELMRTTLEAMHAAGVAHCDLKRKDNTLVAADGRPWLIDFGVGCIVRPRDGKLKRWWFGQMRQMDFNAWVKLQYGREPRNLPPEVAERWRPLLLERVARAIRIPWQKITLRRQRQRWRKRS